MSSSNPDKSIEFENWGDANHSIWERLQPGALSQNVEVLLAEAKRCAQLGVKRVQVAEACVAGGNCGSLAVYPSFQRAVQKVFADFMSQINAMGNVPKFEVGEYSEPTWVTKGADERFPFCGHAKVVFERQKAGLVKRLRSIGCNKLVIGLSGGLDSTLALLVAWSVVGANNIYAFTMPGFGTTSRTRGNAEKLCEGLGIKLETIDITSACIQHFKDIGHDFSVHNVVFENAQARERTQILMDKANQLGGIVLGTGDLSEIALGWSTFNGDHISMFAVNAGVPKTAIREICQAWATGELGDISTPNMKQASQAVLDILATPVSPELLPAVNDDIVQKTEDRLGPYELHDYFLWHFIAEKQDRNQVIDGALAVFEGTYTKETIEKWAGVFFKRIFTQAFKRNCAPDGIQIYPVYFSPFAWYVPSDISVN